MQNEIYKIFMKQKQTNKKTEEYKVEKLMEKHTMNLEGKIFILSNIFILPLQTVFLFFFFNKVIQINDGVYYWYGKIMQGF